jgi:2-phospho-L-lactate guanylyltransferase
MTGPGWSVLVPQKALVRAKGRIELDPFARRALAEAMLRDTVDAIRATGGVRRVMVLWDEPSDVGILTDVDGTVTSGLPLNEALEHVAGEMRREDPQVDLAVVPGDLPALTPEALADCLERATGHARAFLPDATGVGTTVLAATRGTPLVPAYGGCSTFEHAASGAHLIDPRGLDRVRSDVDDLEALARAVALGCGPHTRAAAAALGLTRLVQRSTSMSTAELRV